MRKRMKKNFRVLRELFRIRFQHLMLFRLGFFGPFFVDGSLFAVQLMVFTHTHMHCAFISLSLLTYSALSCE